MEFSKDIIRYRVVCFWYMLNDTEYKEKFEDTKPQIQGQTMQ
jgi:hypothetical protein